MATKWMLVRKTGKREWKACWLKNDEGVEQFAGTTTDKARIDAACAELKALWPGEKYAVVQVTER